jgi:hypothetical protein
VSISQVYYVAQPPSLDTTLFLVPASYCPRPATRLPAHASRDGSRNFDFSLFVCCFCRLKRNKKKANLLIMPFFSLLLFRIRVWYWTDWMSVQYRDWLHYVASKSTVCSQELFVQVSVALVSISQVHYVSQPSMDGTLLVSATTIPDRQLSAYASLLEMEKSKFLFLHFFY